MRSLIALIISFALVFQPAISLGALPPVFKEGIDLRQPLIVKELDAKPTPPPSGQKKIYCKDDGKCYTLDSDDNEKEVGSGAGGGAGGGGGSGINFLTDPNFEDPTLTAWNPKSGLDYEVDEDEALGPNVTAVCVDWDGSPNAVISQIADIAADALGFSNVNGVNLGHKIWVKASFEGLKAEAMHLVGAGPATVANALDIPGDFKWREFNLTSVGTGTLTGVGIRTMPTNSNTGKVCFARASVGPWDGVGEVDQTTLYGTLKYAPAADCAWIKTTGTYDNFSADPDCATPVATGKIGSPSSKIPGFTISEPGVYEIQAQGLYRNEDPADAAYFRMHDGTNPLEGEVAAYSVQGTGVISSLTSIYRKADNTPVTVQIQARNNGTGKQQTIDVGPVEFSFYVKKLAEEKNRIVNIGKGADLLGTIVPALTSQCPAGTLKADGSAIPSQYTALINRIGPNLPDASALVLRGTGTQEINGRTKTGPTNPGDKQEDQMQGHVHGPSSPTLSVISGYGLGEFGINGTPTGTNVTASATTGTPATDGSNGTPRVGAETRVSSLGVTWCVVASHTYQPYVKQAVTTPSDNMEQVFRASGNCSSSSSLTSTNAAGTTIGNISSGQCTLGIPPGVFSEIKTCIPSSAQHLLSALTSWNAVINSSTSVTIGCKTITHGSSNVGDCNNVDFHLICMGPR